MNHRGFTLVELLVSVGLFTIVMVVALGTLLALSEANRKAQLLSTATSNFNSAIDSMSRAIRTGSRYHCGSGTYSVPLDCAAAGATQFAFLSATGQQVVYMFLSNNGTCDNVLGCIVRSEDGGSTFADITSPEIIVTSMRFYTLGAPSSDGLQPKVVILISGYVTVQGADRAYFNIQTSVTQRIFDQ